MALALTAQKEAAERAELLARALSSFPSFARSLCWIAPKDGRRTTLVFNPIQAAYERTRTWRDIVLKPRQIGFTTLELARDVYRFITSQGERSIIVCQTVADAAPPWKKVSADVRRMFEGLRTAGLRLEFGTESDSMWTLPGRDASLQILEAGASVAAAGKKARGGTFSRIHLTEAAFYEHAELTTNAMFEGVPSLPNTSIVIESTPNGVGNWYHSQWLSAVAGRNGYKPHFFPWFMDPGYATPLAAGESIEPETEREHELVERCRITPEQLKWYRAKVELKGQDLVDQEFASDETRTFLTSGRLFFELERLDAMAGSVTRPIRTEPGDEVRVWREPKPGEKFVLGGDAAEGLGPDGDWTFGTMWSRTDSAHVATIRTKRREDGAADLFYGLSKHYNDAEIVIERNKGMALISALERLKARVYYGQDSKPGVNTGPTTRPVLLAELATAVRNGSLRTQDQLLLAEMRAFVVGIDGRPYAPGKHLKDGVGDDGIFSAAMAWHLLMQPPADNEVRVSAPRAAAGWFSPSSQGGF